jgi:ferric iron reductase protein FhuF
MAQHDDAARRARTAEFGDYFALRQAGADDGEALATLLRDETTVRTFVSRTRSAMAASFGCDLARIPARVAASSFQLNVVARLVSPVIGAAAAFGEIPVLTAESVRWLTTESHSPQFVARDLQWVSAHTAHRAAELMSTTILATIAGPLNDTLAATHSLSTRVTWGNAISAANGAVTVMAMSRPDLETAGRDLVRALLRTGPLAGTGDFHGDEFVRRSCCLFYLSPQSGLCGDCVLTASDGSHRTGIH